MTQEDRLTRIENALIAAGLMEPDPMPTDEQILKDARSGDFTSFRKAARIALKKGLPMPLSLQKKRKPHQRTNSLP